MADYARWEAQQGVGLQGGNATDLEQKNGGSVCFIAIPFTQKARPQEQGRTYGRATTTDTIRAPKDLRFPLYRLLRFDS